MLQQNIAADSDDLRPDMLLFVEKVASQRVDWGIIPQNTLRKGWKRGVFIIQTPVNHIAFREEVNPKSTIVYNLYTFPKQPTSPRSELGHCSPRPRGAFSESHARFWKALLSLVALPAFRGSWLQSHWVSMGFPGGHQTWLENAAELTCVVCVFVCPYSPEAIRLIF